MDKKKLIVGNWKMSTVVPEATVLIEKFKKELINLKKTEVIFCPSFIDLYTVSRELQGTDFKLGAQNIFYEEEGAFTGEISPLMIKGFCEYVIIGHSERRIFLGETDKMVAKKVVVAVTHEITPIVCVGETLHENEDGLGKRVAISQLEAALHFVTPSEIAKIIVAYEPVWSVGTGRACNPNQAEKMIKNIRDSISLLYGKKAGDLIRILYGGSVNKKNISSYLKKKEIDGVLVGRASTVYDEFVEIVKAAEKVGGKRKKGKK